MDNNRYQLYLFPFAGGSSYSFQPLKAKIDADFEVKCLEMPGRGRRIQEPHCTSMDALAADYLQQILPGLKPPFAFFGHSMGSVAALLCALNMQAQALPTPSHLFLSGRNGLTTTGKDKLNSLPSEQLWQRLRLSGGVPQAILENHEARDFFEPILRADLKIIEEYAPPNPLVRCQVPITTLHGKEDELVTEAAIAWAELTTAKVEARWFPGDHFFLFQNLDPIRQCLVETLSAGPNQAL